MMKSPTRQAMVLAAPNQIQIVEPREQYARPEISKDSIVIVVMGVTGAGKSTFISLLTEGHVEIGHTLESKTQNVQFFPFPCGPGKTGFIIDTPGFDDTARSDTEILTDITFYLNKLYQRGLRVCGLIYLHRITDPRMGGSAVKNLEVFKRLCGVGAFPNVRLVTTRWNEVLPLEEAISEAEQREMQLRDSDRFWRSLVKAGTPIMRHDGSILSAQNIVKSLLDSDEVKKRPILDIQRESIDEMLPLAQTTAGKFLSREYEEMQRKYEIEMREIQELKAEAIQERDQEGMAMLEAQEQDFVSQQQKLREGQTGLEIDFAKIDRGKQQEIVRKLQAMENVQPEAPPGGPMAVDIKVLEQSVAQLQDKDERRDREQRRLEAENRRLRAQQAQPQVTGQQRRDTDEQIRIRQMAFDKQQQSNHRPPAYGGKEHQMRSTMRDSRDSRDRPPPAESSSRSNPLLAMYRFFVDLVPTETPESDFYYRH